MDSEDPTTWGTSGPETLGTVWTEGPPSRTSPEPAPGVTENHEAAPATRPDHRGRPWALAALVAAACAVPSFGLVMAVTAGSTGSGTAVAAKAGRTFSRPPERCALISSATVDAYLPGTTCNADAYQATDGSQSRAVWSTSPGSTGYYLVDVDVNLTPLSREVYDKMKSQLTSLAGAGATIGDSRPVPGLGDDAYLVAAHTSAASKAHLEIVYGNADIDIDYSGMAGGRAIPQAQAEAAVTAIAHDVLGGLR